MTLPGVDHAAARPRTSRRLPRLFRIASLLLLKGGAGAWALHQGFTHVSDDDYARVVIAERFAHTPSLDPSGTSWLPWPFWTYGAAMLALGRSLPVATLVAWLLGLASILLGYAALRAADVSRVAAWLAAGLAATTPWNAWLGVATVPEAFAGALVFAGAVTLALPRARVLGAVALLVAALSRYEAWPVCAVFAVWGSIDVLRVPETERGRGLVAVLLALAGPCVWMGWNAHAHGSALHFLARVTTFHQRHAGDLPLADRLLTYPRALLTGAPEIVAVGALGVFGGTEVRARWLGPLLCAGAVLVFLTYGEVTGGAPTHHPERALVAVWWVLAGFGIDGARSLAVRHAWARPKREAWGVALGVVAAGAIAGEWFERMRNAPGKSPEEDRAAQVAEGLELRGEALRSVTVIPCAYEHFALIAAFGAPERVTVLGATGGPVTRGCPEVRAH